MEFNMKISNILICAIVPILVASCVHRSAAPVKKIEQPIESDELTLIKQQTELNNPYVVNAKTQLQQLIGTKNFDNYIKKTGILSCQNDENQSSCVLNFYLTEYYKLKYNQQIKKVIEENQTEHKIELSKIKATSANIKNYCDLSADFLAAVYTNDNQKVSSYFQPLFKMSEEEMSSLHAKIIKDNYSHFLIDENPSILQEMKSDFLEKCLDDPKDNIINYINIFR